MTHSIFGELDISISKGKTNTHINFSFSHGNVHWPHLMVFIILSWRVFVIMFLTSMTVISWKRENKFTLKVYQFHKLLTISTKFYYLRSKYLVYKYKSTCRYLMKKGISHPGFYGEVINKAKNKFKSDTFNIVKSLKSIFSSNYDAAAADFLFFLLFLLL